MTINYDIYLWWIIIVISFLLIAFISKKASLRYSCNQQGHIKKSEIKKIKMFYKNINYGIALFAVLSFVSFTVVFGINITTVHKTVRETSVPTTEPPSAIQINESNQQLENRKVQERSERINAAKKKTQDEYDQFLKDALKKEK